MPGAPNKPPESAPAPPPPPTATETPKQKVLRRLVPSRIALTLPIWKGAPSTDLLDPLVEAEKLYTSGDLGGAESALDRLAIRFHEPRWPSLPEPFRSLRVSIPFPQPPQWDPDHGATPAEKEGRRMKKYSESQLALAKGCLALVAAKDPNSVGELTSVLGRAERAFAAGDLGPLFWEPIDEIWLGLKDLVPVPTGPTRKPAVLAPRAEAEVHEA
jgi:hypothetical protein